jgi:hypothetical protein
MDPPEPESPLDVLQLEAARVNLSLLTDDHHESHTHSQKHAALYGGNINTE